MMLTSLNPIAAVTHANPYSYYADLVARKPIYHDDTLGMWVASSADAVTSVLTSDLCRVRPASEPVPKVLLDSPAADIFRHLVRMNDGQFHCPLKQAASITLESIGFNQIAEQSGKWARFLLDGIKQQDYLSRLTDFAFQLPVYVIASLLGVPQNKLSQTPVWLSEFVRCIAPGGSAEQIARGKVSAGHLTDLFRSLLDLQEAEAEDGLLNTLAQELKRVGSDDQDVVVANGIGFLFQAYEATAGLLGNTLVALSVHQDVREQVKVESGLLSNVIEEVIRYDPSIQNTRRFVIRDGIVAGRKMKAGDTVLVVLAAANRDPEVNSHPEKFDIFRKGRRSFTFGVGIHACPGQKIATSIAQIGVKRLLEERINFEQLSKTVSYRQSANTRIPVFTK